MRGELKNNLKEKNSIIVIKKHGGKVRMSQCDISIPTRMCLPQKRERGKSCYEVPEMRSLPSTPHQAVTHSRLYWGCKLQRAPLDEFTRVWEFYICFGDIYCLFVMHACLNWNKLGGTTAQRGSSSTPQGCLRKRMGAFRKNLSFCPVSGRIFSCSSLVKCHPGVAREEVTLGRSYERFRESSHISLSQISSHQSPAPLEWFLSDCPM